MSKRSYRATRAACCAAFFTQAVVINLSPIFFIIYQEKLGISYSMLSMLILINFATQFIVDVLSAKFSYKITHRQAISSACVFCFAGLVLMGVLPQLTNSFAALAVPTVIYSIGGGMTDVFASPISENLPGDHKSLAMSLLHSFYCWGQMAVVIISTLLLRFVGKDLWYIIPFIWSLVPLVNFFNFLTVPIVEPTLNPEENEKSGLKPMLTKKIFIVAMLMMFCAGASEMVISQWSSLFAETGLGLAKSQGDIFGPCAFACMMGIGRLMYGLFGTRINLRNALIFCSVLCVCSYLITSLSPIPLIALIGCALCGLSVSLMWPGVISMTAKKFSGNGTSMFAVLAICGDIGCAAGPWLAGTMANLRSSIPGITIGELNFGILACTVFPILMLAAMAVFVTGSKNKN